MNEEEKRSLAEFEKARVRFENERDEMFKYLFEYIPGGEEINTANVAIDNTVDLNDNEYEWNLREAVKEELFDFYFSSLHSKLVDFFEVEHPELRYDFRNAALFDSGYKTFIYFAVGGSIASMIKKHTNQIPEFVNDNDDYRIYLNPDPLQADKCEGLKIVKVFTEMKNRSSYNIYLTEEEVSWFIDEQIDDILSILKIVSENIKFIGNIKTRDPKDATIIEKTFQLKNSKNPLEKYTNKEAITDAIKILGYGETNDNELTRLEKIFRVESFKRNHSKN